MDGFYFDRNGQPMELMAWAQAFEDFDGRLVARTQVGSVTVLTLWLGTPDVDETPPLIFGSIIEVGEAYSHEIRTPTEADALRAHEDLVALAEQRYT